MKFQHFFLLLVFILFFQMTNASHKVYLIHGYGGTGLELHKIQKAIEDEGYKVERLKYHSLRQDVDSVGKVLATRIHLDTSDTISFVTHSMGGIVVRTLYDRLESLDHPYIHRIVMLAPPSKGSPVADYFEQFALLRFVGGPNLHNLSTDSISGAAKYPIPTCELGVIIGQANKKHCFTVPLKGDNDGVVLNKHTTLGVEKDVFYVKASHILMLFNDDVSIQVCNFLKDGEFNDTAII